MREMKITEKVNIIGAQPQYDVDAGGFDEYEILMILSNIVAEFTVKLNVAKEQSKAMRQQKQNLQFQK